MVNDLSIFENKLKLLPESLFRKFGCSGNCYLRGTDKCPVTSRKENYPIDMICRERQEWILTHLPDYDKKPSHAEVMLDFAKSIGHMRYVKDYELMENLEKAKKALEEKMAVELQEEKIKIMKKQLANIDYNINQAFSRWSIIFKQTSNLENEKLKMETPKKVDITRRDISPVDVADLIDRTRKKSIDVQGEVKEIAKE